MANFIDLEEMMVFSKIRKKVLSGSTNQIIYNQKDKRTLNLILPAYSRIKMNSIANIDYTMLKAELHCDFYFTINVTGLEREFVKFIKGNVVVFFNNNEPIELKEEDEDVEMYVDEQIQVEHNRLLYHYLHFEVKKVFTTSLIPNVFWTPFETSDLILSINPKVLRYFEFAKFIKENQNIRHQFNDVYFSRKGPVSIIRFTFNCMDCKNNIDKINFPTKAKFGNYRIATSMLKAEYTNEASTELVRAHSDEINKTKETQQKEVDFGEMKHFQVSHFIITLYKNPNSAIATIFVPLWLLSIINMGIFYQSTLLAGRIENLTGLMFAFVAIITVIRQQIPPNRQITFIEYLVYLVTFTTLICLIQGLTIRDSTTFKPQFGNVFFLIALSISGASFLIILVMIILHKTVWLPTYLKEKVQTPSDRFNHLDWGNMECDKHFLKFFDNGSVKALIYDDAVEGVDD